jgi:hypothetical protein
MKEYKHLSYNENKHLCLDCTIGTNLIYPINQRASRNKCQICKKVKLGCTAKHCKDVKDPH